jgi:serine/threonine protein kinase/Tfp pilus assembly protein PilF
MIGKTISHYKILEKLGEGGMGVVYKAEDTRLKRTVALKFFNPQMLGTEEDRARFILEAQTAAALDHPNICTIYEIDEVDDQTFIAMAYVDGQSLEEKVESGVLEISEALDIAMQVAQGLKEAHKKGIVHRDIKSANIMVTADGKAKIMDFGLAKLAGRTRLTKTSTIMGTVAYMSPEQASGEANIDHRTDIWSLGVVLYKMLTGYPPFDAPSDAALIHKIIYDELKPVSSLRGDIPTELEAVIKKMLQKNPQDRYQEITAVIRDIHSVKTRMETVTKESVPSIAVLPFVNMSADPEQEYFCDGLAEELINALTKLQNLRVIARTSAFSFKGKNVNVRDIGRELDVGAILEGSVRKVGNRLRITAQLVDSEQGHHLWSERYDREMDDIFAIQDEITLAIVDSLKPRLAGGEKERIIKRSTVDLDAYNLYLKANWFYSTHVGEGLKKAIEYFEQTIKKDSRYAPAYVGLARSLSSLPVYSNTPIRDISLRARDAIGRALELDEELAEAHAVNAWIMMNFEWDWEGAERECKRAIELNPGSAISHYYYGQNFRFRARFDEAISELKRAHELDPLSVATLRLLGEALLYLNRYDEAITVFKKGLELSPAFPWLHNNLGLAYEHMCLYEEALAEFEAERHVSRFYNSMNESCFGVLYARMGKTVEAKAVLSELLERSREEEISGFAIAHLCVVLGRIDEAFEWLERAYESRDVWLLWLKVAPHLEPIRSDKRYLAMLKKVGLDT